MLLVSWSQFAWVKATNFGGWDEWLCISLSAEGIVDHPYPYRPLGVLWQVSAALAKPHDLRSYLVLHAVYIGLSGWLVFALCRRLAPQSLRFAYLAGALSVVWAPLDWLRLNAVNTLGYSGATMATLCAIVLFVESWFGRRGVVLAVACLAAGLASLTNEGTLPLLCAGPLALLWVTPQKTRLLWLWVTCWAVLILVLGGAILYAHTHPVGSGSYQLSAMRLDPSPLPVLRRWAQQFGFHLLPLLTTPVRELAVPAVPMAVGVFVIAGLLIARSAEDGLGSRFDHLRLAALGILLAGLGNGIFALSPSVVSAARIQFLSSPGIAMFLASVILLISARLKPRLRVAACLAAGSWVVAVGTGRLVAMQRDWDTATAWPNQNRTLWELTRQAPDLKPNTFVVLVDEGGAWPASFTFRHALRYLYPGHAIGAVWKANDFLYPIYFLPDGIHSVPWPVIQRPWRDPPTRHDYGEVMVVRLDTAGKVTILERWPSEFLPPLPSGAVYDPEGRVLRPAKLPAERAILSKD
jgi:hypothetical protein